MAKDKSKKQFRPKPRLPRGFRDIGGAELERQQQMITTLAAVYRLHGFMPLDSAAFEYADALGKFLPDDDRPNEGVFSLQDDDEQWLSLRYDLTAPLARYVAEHYDSLPKPFRRYQWGHVWRNEKSGPGRYRQFLQMDADTVGAANMAADAEICMLAVRCMEAVGLSKGAYQIRVNNRKIMDGLLQVIGLSPDDENYEQRRLTILRAMDKYDRLGAAGVEALLGAGRKDESGDFTKGAELTDAQIAPIARLVAIPDDDRTATLAAMAELVGGNASGKNGLAELAEMDELFTGLGFGAEQICIAPPVVRGLGYYTGPIFEIELGFEVEDENGKAVPFGSVGGGGRYDDLIKRFKGVEVPATGISIGISRLAAALELRDGAKMGANSPPVIVLVMDKQDRPDLLELVQTLQKEGIAAEMYMGDSAMKAQLRYADNRGAWLALIIGEDERKANVITIKDLRLGQEKAATIQDNKEWRASAHAQQQIPRADIVGRIKEILGS
ncbi:MAG: histidine--tRNA ligase [Alphaproteobacteria bacterium]|nr:histidine--tRNA ligase [Alphaproteobacteria bacterium]